MKQSIQLRLGQHLSMTPQLQQAIKLLQLSNLELQQEIQEVLDSNFMLEEGDEADRFQAADAADARLPQEAAPETTATVQEQTVEREVQGESSEMPDELPVDTQWDDVYENYLPSSSHGSDDNADFDPLSQQSRPETLHDHLLWQLNLARLSPRDEAIALAVIDAIDGNGYLRTDCEELLATLGEPDLSPEEVTTVIHRVQSFDPPGVGARDLRECLVIQLSQLATPTAAEALALAICEQGFDYLPRNDVVNLARLLGQPEAAIATALEVIRRLNPRPGTLIAETPADAITADYAERRLILFPGERNEGHGRSANRQIGGEGSARGQEADPPCRHRGPLCRSVG